MSLNTRLLESINIVTAFPPSDINADASGDWISLKNYDGVLVCFHKVAGTAGDDPSIKLQQATAVAGTGAKALNFNHIYTKIGSTALSATGLFTKFALTTATDDLDLVSVNSSDLLTDINETLVVVDIRASDLDVTNGFDCLNIEIEGDDLGNSTYAAAWYILYGARYPQASPLSAIVN